MRSPILLLGTGRFLSGVLNVTSRRHPDSRCTPVLFAEPDIELTRRNWLARVALSVTVLALANSLSPDLGLERVANECRPGGLSGPGYFVDDFEQL